MADFSALKTSIQNYIKENGNEEITGNLLQQILLSMVSTLGDSAINDLVTALNAEIANRGNADTELGGRITTLQGVVNGIKANVENGYVYAGIATPSTTPVSGKVFYLALTAGTYTNFGATVVPQGINILKYNGSAWSLDSFLGLDDAPTQGSNNLVKSGGVLDSIIKDGSAFDLSAYNNGTTYADLSAALTALNALPAAYKKGGMSVKFVQSSDNKYIQATCMAQNFTTDVTQWQGVDDEPTAGSGNLVKSGGVYLKIDQEKNRAEAAEGTLQQNINAEKNRAETAEGTLQQNINAEKNRAETAERSLHHEIQSEEDERKQEIQDVRDDVFSLIHDYQPIVIEGNVVNAPDEEDITQQPNNLLKFKDKAYNPTIFSGLGRKYLRKNVVINEDYVIFDGFLENPECEELLVGTPDAILWARLPERFVAKKDDLYYLDWEESEDYIPVNADKIYVNDNIPYTWNGEDLIVDDNLIERYGNTLTQEMMSDANTIYVIQYDFTLGEDITIPENCILEFDGGSISGEYTLNIGESVIKGCENCFKSGLHIITGSQPLYYSWFEYVEVEDIIESITNESTSITPIKFYIDKSITISKCIVIDANIIILDGLNNIITCNGCDGIKIVKSGLRGMSTVVVANIQLDGINATYKGISIQGENGSSVHSIEIQNCKITNFNIGAWFGDHAWLITYNNCSFYNNVIGLESKSSPSDAGENYRIRASVIANNDRGVRCSHASFFFEGCSFDYNVIDFNSGNATGDINVSESHIEKRLGENCGRNSETIASYVVEGYVKYIATNCKFVIFSLADYTKDAIFNAGDHGSLDIYACSFYLPNRIKYLSKGNEHSFKISDTQLYTTFCFDYFSPKYSNVAQPVLSNLFRFLDKATNVTVWEGSNGFQTNGVGNCIFYIPLNNIGWGSFACIANDDISDRTYKKLTVKKGFLDKGNFSETATIINAVTLTLSKNESYNINFTSDNCNCLQVTINNIIGDTRTLNFVVNVENEEKNNIEIIDSIDSLGYNTPQREYIYTPTKKRIRVIGRGVAVDMNGNDYETRKATLPTNANDGFIFYKSNDGLPLLRINDAWEILPRQQMPTFESGNIALFIGTTERRPTSGVIRAGFQYFDTTLGKPIWWTGSAWVDATGATV